MKLIISDKAKKDLFDIWMYIARDNIIIADEFTDNLYKQCELITTHPEMGRKRFELLPGVRSLSFKRYIIYYQISNENIEIIRILSGYRDLLAIF